ncbi:hypothetical protein MIZ03_4533 [Rhodoferax lithotrophicus]|uniref:Uncharacterized protein n=1 Tax=Rhodoferax lithotrophicus TaxID=2798804 RepID=A0ABN6DCE3_9BURK|nr:DUF6776 family protein [Rhodoferax sp. MIZ03]BCO29610.1 hypothetical protein MIZ03_4533 [Rhodoferax sp. MIZ03]
MRLRLLMRRLTVSAPRMAVRSALPWPLRWAMLAIVAGFCAAIALWAFEFGKDIAGLDKGNKSQLEHVQQENAALLAQVGVLKDERNKAQSIADTADTLLTAGKVTQEKLSELNRQLQADNQRLKSDLGFFERLIPASGVTGLSIRGLQADLQKTGELKWQVLIIQSDKNPVEFKGRLELTFVGTENGRPWTGPLPGGPQAVQLGQYGRLEGLFALPPNVKVSSLTAKVLEGQSVRAVQTLKL